VVGTLRPRNERRPSKSKTKSRAKIAEALRVHAPLSRNSKNLATKPTENLQAYDLYLRGQALRPARQTRQDLEFALQMFEKRRGPWIPASPWPTPPAPNACAMFYCNYSRDGHLGGGAPRNASGKAVALRWDLPESNGQPGLGCFTPTETSRRSCAHGRKKAIERKARTAKAPTISSAGALFSRRPLPGSDQRNGKLRSKSAARITTSTFPSPTRSAPSAKKTPHRNLLLRRIGGPRKPLEAGARRRPRARVLMATDYAELGRV